jgi:hypothetical protein
MSISSLHLACHRYSRFIPAALPLYDQTDSKIQLDIRALCLPYPTGE